MSNCGRLYRRRVVYPFYLYGAPSHDIDFDVASERRKMFAPESCVTTSSFGVSTANFPKISPSSKTTPAPKPHSPTIAELVLKTHVNVNSLSL